MSVSNNDELKNKFLISEIEETDTLSQFMEKCNNNFSTIFRMGGGPDGVRGNKGDQGNPTKPKVPIHVWKKGVEYDYEKSNTIGFEINECIEDLSDVKYQDGHLILLENAHLYQLELDNNFNLKPKFIIELLSFDPSNISDGKNSYIHIAYANDIVNYDGFITDQQLRNENYEDETEQVSTFDLNRTVANNVNVSNMPYMGIYSDDKEKSSNIPYRYTWISIQGRVGEIGPRGPKGDTGPKGDKGDKGDSYTGHPFTVDLEGDMSTISIDIDRTRLYDDSGDYCECIAHAYYGKDSVKLNPENISILLSDEYVYDDSNNTIYSTSSHRPVGEIEISEITNSNNVSIKFTPHKSFVFPKKTMIFPIHIECEIVDGGKTYNFERDTVWSIRGIMSTFELEIVPQYKSIKLDTDGKYYPEKLFVDVYKVEDAVRTLFDIKNSDSDNDGIVDFTLLYKDYDSNEWLLYPDDGVDTKDVSCLEFKVVRYYNSESEEVWDYEDVWVVADGKSVHYYHADLGNTESMMVLTTGDKINIGTKDDPKYCAELRNSKGYTITFEPKFYDGTEELKVTKVNIGTNSGEIYYSDGTFVRELTEEIIDGVVKKCNLTITNVPYGVDIIPMNIVVLSEDNKSDTVSFNLYITTLTDTYTLVPSVSSFNTSTGKTGDTISCAVYKNNTLIEFSQIPTELEKIGLKLKYAVHNEKTTTANIITYTEPIIFGDDDDIDEDEFTSSDVAIVFILYYNDKEIVRSTVPLIKDGIDGADGDCWQYIFCRSPRYPFDKTGISYPNGWKNDPKSEDSNSEYLGDDESDYPDYNKDLRWYDDHLEINSEYKYEYQAYRKWDKTKNCWGKYGAPTLYSNYSESGSGYSVILSNPIAVIPVGYNDWSVDENAKNQSDSTFVYLYNTTKDISKDGNVSISIPENLPEKKYFKIEKENDINKVTFTPVINNDAFDFSSNTQYKLPITLTYDLGEDADGDSTTDKFTTTINWTLSPMKGLEDVEVFVDKRVVNTSIADVHPLKVGYYLNFSNGVKITVDIANTDNVLDKKNTKNYQIKLTNDISSDLSEIDAVTDWQNASYKFIDDDGNKRNCYVVLVDSDGKTIIDYIDVIPVNNGNNGTSPTLYEIIPEDSYFMKSSNNTSGSGHISGRVYKIIGNSRESITNLKKYDFNIPNGGINKDDLYVAAGYYKEDGTFAFCHNPNVTDNFFDTENYFKNIPDANHDVHGSGLLKANTIVVQIRDYNNNVLTTYNVSASKQGMDGVQFAPIRVGTWAEGTTYYAGDGPNDQYSDITIDANGGYYRCKKSHIACYPGSETDGDINNLPKQSLKEGDYWSKTDKYNVVATDLLLAKATYIENLIAMRIQTAIETYTPRLVAYGSTVEFYGKKQYPALSLGTDKNGNGVLIYNNQDTGKAVYQLDINGISNLLLNDTSLDEINNYYYRITCPSIYDLGDSSILDEQKEHILNYINQVSSDDFVSYIDYIFEVNSPAHMAFTDDLGKHMYIYQKGVFIDTDIVDGKKEHDIRGQYARSIQDAIFAHDKIIAFRPINNEKDYGEDYTEEFYTGSNRRISCYSTDDVECPYPEGIYPEGSTDDIKYPAAGLFTGFMGDYEQPTKLNAQSYATYFEYNSQQYQTGGFFEVKTRDNVTRYYSIPEDYFPSESVAYEAIKTFIENVKKYSNDDINDPLNTLHSKTYYNNTSNLLLRPDVEYKSTVNWEVRKNYNNTYTYIDPVYKVNIYYCEKGERLYDRDVTSEDYDKGIYIHFGFIQDGSLKLAKDGNGNPDSNYVHILNYQTVYINESTLDKLNTYWI